MIKKRNITKWVISLVLGVMLISQNPSKAQATGHTETASLVIVLWNTIYGAAIGIPVGLAIWGLTQEGNENDSPWESSLIRGAAYGTLLGVGYGFYEVNRLGGFANKSSVKRGFVHYETNQFHLSLAEGLPYLTFEEDTLKYNSTIFTAAF